MEMKSDSLFELIEAIKQTAFNASSNELYIPLHGKHTTNPEEEPFDLAEKIQSFVVFDDASRHDPKVMLLMGDTGSGKSVFSQQMHHQLWRAYKSGDPIPLWIPLPELQNPFEGAVEEVLTKYGFDDRQISEIKAQEKFIFIVDGYDELHQFQNCYVTNKWEKWNAKVLMTCRSQALYYQKDPDKYFMPFTGEKRLPLLLRRLYVSPFSKEKISAYVKQYQQLNNENKIAEEDFSKVPGLTELISTPFLLHLAVEALPDILANQVDDEKMTQAKLYDVFIERWFTRQVKKLSTAGLLKNTEQNTKQQFWDYCKRLAQQMHEKNVSVIPYQGQKVGGRLFGKQEKTTIWESFFNEETEVLRSACPLKRFGNHNYGFVHASMVEYFATRAMYEEIQDNEFIAQNPIIASEARQSSDVVGLPGSLRVARDDEPRKNNQPHGGIHQRLFSLERQSIRFLADRIEMNEEFKYKMRSILEASKKNKQYAIAAANAITALVKAGVTFNCADLSGIKISGSEISGGFFDNADLSNADLSNSLMINVWMRETKLEGSNVEGCNFGEYPWFKPVDSVDCFDYREDLQYIVIPSDKDVILWDTISGEQVRSFNGHESSVSCVQFSPDGKWIASGDYDGNIRLWEVSSGNEIALLKGHESQVRTVSFSHNGELLASGSGGWSEGGDNSVRIWDVVNGDQIAFLRGHYRGVQCLHFSADGKQLVSGGEDRAARVWDVKSGEELAVFHEGVECVKFNPYGNLILLGTYSSISIWDITNQKSIAKFEVDETQGSSVHVRSAAFSPDGQRIVAGYNDKTVRIWEVASRKAIAVLLGHEGDVSSVQFNPDGKLVVSSDDRTVRIWDVSIERYSVRKRGHYQEIPCIRLSHDGKLAASGSKDKTIRIWEVCSGKEIATLTDDWKVQVQCVQFSPDGKSVVSGYRNGMLIIWDVATRKIISKLRGHDNQVNSVAFSSDGKMIVSGSGTRITERSAIDTGQDYTIRIWDVTDSHQIIVLQGHKDRVMSVAFSEDGSRVVSGSSDGTVRIWEVKSGEEILVIPTNFHDASVKKQCVVFSPNEEIVACGIKNYLYFFDVENGEKIYELSGHYSESITRVQYSRDGKWVMVGNGISIRILDVEDYYYSKEWNFHAEVMDFSYHSNGLLVISFYDDSIECWKNIGDEQDFRWQLRWSTNIDNPNLFVIDLHASDVIGLSAQNRRMLEQRGAKIKVELISEVSKQIRNPNNLRLLEQKGTKTGVKSDASKVIAFYEQGFREYHASNHVLAACVFDNARSLDPLGSVLQDFDKEIIGNAYRARADKKYKKGHYKDAIVDYDEAIQMNPSDAVAFSYRGFCKYNKSSYKDAIIDFDNAIQLNPNEAHAYKGRGLSKFKIDQHAEAILDFDEAIHLNHDDTLAYFRRGYCKYLLSDYEGALADMGSAFDIDNTESYEFFHREFFCYFGRSEYNLGSYYRAKKAYDIAIRLQSSSPSVILLEERGHCNYALQHYDDALVDYDEAVREYNSSKPIEITNDIDYAELLNNRGRCKANLGRYQEAIMDFDEAIKINPQDAQVIKYRKMCESKLGLNNEEILEFDEAIKIKPKSVQVFIYCGIENTARTFFNRAIRKAKLGYQESALRDIIKAIGLWSDENALSDFEKEIIKIDLKLAAAYYYHSGLKKLNSDYKDEINDFEISISLDPDETLIKDYDRACKYYLYGSKKHSSNLYADAIVDYDEAVRLYPENAITFSSRGICKFMLGLFSEAIVDFSEVIRLNPKESSIFKVRGQCKLYLDLFEEAITDYDEAIRLKPDKIAAITERGSCKLKLGQSNEAILDYDEVIRLNSDNGDAYFSRGQCNEKLGHLKDALLDYDNAIRLNPKDVEAITSRGMCKLKLGIFSDAIADLDEVIQQNPNGENGVVVYLRGLCKANLGLYFEAITAFDEVIRLAPDATTAIAERASCKLKLGQFNEAILDYDEVIRLNPNDASAFRNRGMSNLYLHRYENAMQDFDRAIECADSTKDSILILLILSNKAFTFFLQDLLQESQDTLTQAYAITADNQNKSSSTFQYSSNLCSLVQRLLRCASGNIDEADILLRATGEYTSNDPSDRCELMTMLGIGFSHLKCYQRAIECWEKVIAENPNYRSAFVQKENLMRSLATSSAQSEKLREPQQRAGVQDPIKEDAISPTHQRKTNWSTVKRTSSPIHHNDDNEREDDTNEEEEEKAQQSVIVYENNKLK